MTESEIRDIRSTVPPTEPRAFCSKALELKLPAPIAFPFARFNMEATATDKLLLLADALEAILRYLAFVTAADILSQDPEEPELHMILSERFHIAPQLGSWETVLKKHMTILSRSRAFIPDLVEFWSDPKIEKLLGKLRGRRNQKIHQPGSAARLDKESTRLLDEVKPLFLLLVDRLSFLGAYELVAARRAPAYGATCYEVVRFMGANPRIGWHLMHWNVPEGQTLPEDKPFLCAPDGSALLCLWPFLHSKLVSASTLAPSLAVLAGFQSTPELGKIPENHFLYTSVEDRTHCFEGPEPAGSCNRFDWLAAEARTYACCHPGPLASSLRVCLEAHRPHWEGKSVAGQRGSYHVDRKVADGGMGTVYLASSADHHVCCLKFIRMGRSYDEQLRRRFQRQLSAFQRCGDHPYLVKILDHGQCTSPEGIECFLVMEWAEGGDLTRKIQQWGPLTTREGGHGPGLVERLELFTKIVQAVAHLHGNQIIHRDIKPSNILLSAEEQPLLADLDLVRTMFAQTADERITSQGTPVGTPLYMAPEQREGLSEASAATDIYALGLLLYELMLATPAMPHLVDARSAALTEFGQIAGRELQRLLDLCTRPLSEERYQHGNELLAFLTLPASVLPMAVSGTTAAEDRKGDAGARKEAPAVLVPWRELPDQERSKVTQMIACLGRGDFARLNILLKGMSSAAARMPLLRVVQGFCRSAVKLKFDLTADNRAEIATGVDTCLAALSEMTDLYRTYTEILQPAVVTLAGLLTSLARTADVTRDIRDSLRRFAKAQSDNALLRRLEELS
jgi:serine/threonine protein kinase